MKIPVETKPALWGAAAGDAALAFIGFNFAGWTTSGKAEIAAVARANTAVVTAMAPMCVDRFRKASDVAANTEALKKTDSWAQGDFVEKGGWATMPGATVPADQLGAVAKACAVLLAPA